MNYGILYSAKSHSNTFKKKMKLTNIYGIYQAKLRIWKKFMVCLKFLIQWLSIMTAR